MPNSGWSSKVSQAERQNWSRSAPASSVWNGWADFAGGPATRSRVGDHEQRNHYQVQAPREPGAAGKPGAADVDPVLALADVIQPGAGPALHRVMPQVREHRHQQADPDDRF